MSLVELLYPNYTVAVVVEILVAGGRGSCRCSCGTGGVLMSGGSCY